MNAPNHQGFLLLEAMLALAILTGAVLVAFQPARASLRTTQASRQFYQAALLLEDHLTAWEKTGMSDLGPMEDPVLGRVTWQQDILPESERLTLHWGEGDHAQHLELETPTIN